MSYFIRLDIAKENLTISYPLKLNKPRIYEHKALSPV